MNRLCVFAGMTIFGYATWFAADALGASFFTAFLLSGLGSMIGVFIGWKVAQRFS